MQHRCRQCEARRVASYQAANPEKHIERGRRWKRENPERKQEADRTYRNRLRDQVLGHYGRACACCSATEDLSIDHVTGDGKQHRLEVLGPEFYRWLIEQGFPPGFQTLCRPCNRSKGNGDRCKLDHANPERRTVHQRRKAA